METAKYAKRIVNAELSHAGPVMSTAKAELNVPTDAGSSAALGLVITDAR